MKKIIKIKPAKIGVYQERLDEIVIDPDVLTNDRRRYGIIAQILGENTANKLIQAYVNHLGREVYNLVLLTDEELNGLEAKSKQ
jgi:hypothetical protein